jgi:pantothenate kinase-related protein Tda10
MGSGSLKVKSALTGYEELLAHAQKELGPNRRPLLIAIDGPDGVGKSALASWLACQLEIHRCTLTFILFATVSHSNGELTI